MARRTNLVSLGVIGLFAGAALTFPPGCGGSSGASPGADAGDDGSGFGSGGGGDSGAPASSGSSASGASGSTSGASGSSGTATSSSGAGGSGSSGSSGSSGGSTSGADGGRDSGSGSGSSSGSSASGASSGSGGSASSSGSSASSSSSSSGSGGATSDGGVVGGVPGGVAGPGVTVQGCTIFPADNPWNTAIDGPNVMVTHDYDSQIPQSTHLHPDWGDYTTNHYGIPYSVVPATQPDLSTVFNYAANESDPGPGGWVGTNPVTADSTNGTTAYPFFVGMPIEGDPGPGGTPGSLPNDQHALILQQGPSACTLYEAWQCLGVAAAPFRCANGAVFNLNSNALRPAGWTSADAAGLPIFPGLVRLAEVQAGAIHHAIRLTFNATQGAYIRPATHAASSNGSPYPPMGLRLRLKASVVTTSYIAASQVIMAALKKYGFIVADNGSDWYFQGDSDDGWDAMAPDGQDTLIDEVSSDFRHLTGADFETIYSGDPVTTGL